jgi:carnosine N-methyltransferase
MNNECPEDLNSNLVYKEQTENSEGSSNKNVKGNIFQQNEIYTEDNEDLHSHEQTSNSKRPLDDPAEMEHLKDICSAFFNYQVDSLRDVMRMERDFSSIPVDHIKFLKYNYKERLEKLKKAIWRNYLFLLKIVSPYSYMFKFFKNDKNEILIQPLRVSHKDVIKMRSTLKLFIRDWTKEGEVERENTYTPILKDFKNFFPNPDGIKVLLPGVGLGRLLYEFAKAGYKAQGNEFSYFMLLSSNFILNCTTTKEEYEIQPLIHSFSNLFWEDAPFKQVKVPDENLMEELKNSSGEMSMVAGEFVDIYKNQLNSWDGLVTCFFLDTANNIIEYIETIHKILKIGGLWVNMGPLLYHYSEIEKECSIELSWDEVKYIIVSMGFEIKKEDIKESVYSSDCDSMMKTVYRCIYFTAVKIK